MFRFKHYLISAISNYLKKKPLKIRISEATSKKLEELFDRNALDNYSLIRKTFEEAKHEAVEVVNAQLNKFREVKQMGKQLKV
jgi:hypothetical protein